MILSVPNVNIEREREREMILCKSVLSLYFRTFKNLAYLRELFSLSYITLEKRASIHILYVSHFISNATVDSNN